MTSLLKERDYGIDFLRILLAIMVIIIHINAPATGAVSSHVTRLPMKFLIYGTMSLVYPAVNCYVLISGFYSYKNNRSLRSVLSSLLKLWLCLLFFSLGGYLVFCLLGFQTFTIKTFINRLLPITSGEWWFMTNYFVLMVMSPVLNHIITITEKKHIKPFLIITLLICSVVPFFIKYNDVLGLLNGSGLIWFIVLYLTGGYIYKFYTVENRNYRVWIFKPKSYFFLYIVLSLSLVITGFIFGKIHFFNGYTFSMYNSPIVYFQAIFLFLAFWHINITRHLSRKIIVFLSGLSLASYIFHCQADIEKVLWGIFSPSVFANSVLLVPLSCGIILTIYLSSIIIEYIRTRLFSINGIEKRIINNAIDHCCRWL